MGYLCTGKTEEAHQESRIKASQQEEKQNNVLLEIQQKGKDSKPQLALEDNDDLDMWERRWTLQSQVNTALITLRPTIPSQIIAKRSIGKHSGHWNQQEQKNSQILEKKKSC
ncbi:hypothetical protein KIN20_016265 [Parelaphostrongylus tenuis]|uniref:Uncharacterized protein n=1 Tax=Parelaphostrongylus tenuis TaxID=148309 RepID=A0AAD5MH71_PARTN|nr:hypothetical protein KIN20_016265 [Parelaphostrongylus tenuis]